MNDIDVQLKALFDQRLGALEPPPHTTHPTRRPVRVLAAAATAVIAVAGVGLVMDVNSVAATNGADCANFLTKVQVWAQSHRSDLAGTDHSAARAELARMVAASGCAPHNAGHDASHTGPHH